MSVLILDKEYEEYIQQKEEVERLNNIINKAIEYIEEHSHNSYFSMLQGDYNMSLNALLDILQGSDKE